MIEICILVIVTIVLLLNIWVLLVVMPQASFLLKVGSSLQKISYQLDVLIRLHQGKQIKRPTEESGLVDLDTPDINYDPRYIRPKN
jgi:hypothetical protein